jgi:predicted nucleic acid-binding protein
MIVVSDTSSLCSLALINHLSLLPQLYQTVIIPPVVADELAIAPDSKITNILPQPWIKIQPLQDSHLAEELQRARGLDPGESYAIALAVELKADSLLIDERLGRLEAKKLGIPIIGILGILILAKQRHLIGEVKPVMNRLIRDASFRVSSQLYQQILALAKEE